MIQSKKRTQRFLSFLLVFALLFTVAPITKIAKAEPTDGLNPVPQWSDGAVAYANLEGDGINISFPKPVSAGVDTTDSGVTYQIAYYIIRLFDITNYSSRNEVKLEKKVDASQLAQQMAEGKATNLSVMITREELSEAGITLETDHYYNVQILAVNVALRDGQPVEARSGWRSESLDAIVSNAPIYSAENLVTDIVGKENNYIRIFADGDQTGSSDNDHSNNYVVNNEGLTDSQLLGFQPNAAVTSANVNSPTDTPLQWYTFYNRAMELSDAQFRMTGLSSAAGVSSTNAYRFLFKDAVDNSKLTSVDMWYRRSQWNFDGAKEMWVWVDLNDVKLDELYFRMRYNDKLRDKNNSQNVGYDRLSSTIFTTKNFTGTKEVYYQNEEGFWAKKTIRNGNFASFSGYKGYIRIPIEMFVGLVPEYDYSITVSSLGNWTSTPPGTWKKIDRGYHEVYDESGNYVYTLQNEEFWWQDWYGGMHFLQPKYTQNADGNIVVNKKKISIDKYDTYRYAVSVGNGTRLRGVDLEQTGVNQAKPKSALSDIYTFGFSASTASGYDNTNKAFYIDDIAGYYEDGDVPGRDPADAGTPEDKYLKDLYDPSVMLPQAIVNYIMKYVHEQPTLLDRQVAESAQELIKVYVNDDVKQGIADIRNNASIEDREEAMDRLEAVMALIDSMNLVKADGVDPFVAYLENQLEVLPNIASGETLTVNFRNNPTLAAKINDLYAVYRSLNLKQLNLLGTDCAYKLETLYSVISDKEIVGDDLSGTSWITFNDFENVPYGTRADEARDDAKTNAGRWDNAREQRETDIIHRSRLSQYGVNWPDIDPFTGSEYQLGKSDDEYDPVRWSGFDVEVKDGGYKNSNSLNVTLRNTIAGNATVTVGSNRFNGQTVANWNEYPSMDISAYKNNSPSIAFFMDLTDAVGITTSEDPSYQDFKFTVTITTGGGGDGLQEWRATWGEGALSQIYYLVEGDGSEQWKQFATMSSNYLHGREDLGTSLAGKKVWFKVPLSAFTTRSAQNGDTGLNLAATDDALASIKQVLFTFPSERKPHTIKIDNIGFTFGTTNDGYKNFDEVYGAQSAASSKFINDVLALDVFADSVAAANEIARLDGDYEALSSYQKTLTNVINAKSWLETKRAWLANENGEFNPYKTADEINAYIQELKNYPNVVNFTGSEKNPNAENQNIPYPGYINTAPEGETKNYAVDYSALGIDAGTADEIIKVYNEGYKRLTAEQRSQISSEDTTALKNAYYAAIRLNDLEDYLAQRGEVGDSIMKFYSNTNGHDHDGYSILDLTSEESRKEAIAIVYGTKYSDSADYTGKGYYDVSYFAKLVSGKYVGTDKMGAVSPENMLDAMRNALPMVGENGAVWKYADYVTNELVPTVKAKLDSQTALSDGDWTNIQRTEDYFQALDHAYPQYTCTERADAAWHTFREMFNIHKMAQGTNVVLTEKLTSIDSAFKAEYIMAPINIAEENYNGERDRGWVGKDNKVPTYITDVVNADNYIGVADGELEKAKADLVGYGVNTFKLTNSNGDEIPFTVTFNDAPLALASSIIDLSNTVEGVEQKFNLKISVTSEDAATAVGGYGDYTGALYISAGSNGVQVVKGEDGNYAVKDGQTIKIPISFQVEEGYTVTIPAENKTVTWNDTNDIQMGEVKAELNVAKEDAVIVSATSANADASAPYRMKPDSLNSYIGYNLQYKRTTDSAYKPFESIVFCTGAGAGPNAGTNIYNVKFNVPQSEWDKNDLYAGTQYKDTLTFDISYQQNWLNSQNP